eukprot:TRINITY_DN23439_c0_g1_i1.p1 TRINITY_DN23439_c0_g1~~TRINITY_DN23439_c0_g1_i1.p1  ORF type:complete len:3484 (+),score=873.59 TRINITY_DN23439_c0_g1_i1:112-10563(+)
MAAPREKQPLALRTVAGPVDLRPGRQARKITVADGGGAKTISQGWLKDQKGDGNYQKAVKQAMMIASEEIKLLDSTDNYADAAGMTRSLESPEQIKAKIQALQAGQTRVTTLSAKKKSLGQVVKNRHERQRDTLIKISKKRPCMGRVERSFLIDNGELLVYRDHHPNAKVKAFYQLKNATCFYEEKRTSSLPRWQEGFDKRLRVICQEREAQSKSPLFLYSKDDAKIHRWKRAFTLAKVLVAENDRRALKVSIGRATSGALMKAWDALSLYFGEYSKTKALVKNMAMRLMKVDISRGWMKMKLVYRKAQEEKKRRKEQQLWAARFMSERLTKLGKQSAKGLSDVREGLITRIQQRFRTYREDMIFDRTYPLSSNMMSRVQQAKLGKVVDFAMQTVTGEEACRLSLQGRALDGWERDRDIFKTTMPNYSALTGGSLQTRTVLVYAADNLASLSFSDHSEDTESYAALNKTDWSKFVNHDRISSVILHSDPCQGAGLAAALKGGYDAGVWCTINGPRVAWDKRIKNIVNEKKQTVPTVFGASDGMLVGSALANPRANPQKVKWVKLRASLKDFTLPKQAPPVAQTNIQGDADQELRNAPEYTTVAVMHLLGWSFSSEPVVGNNGNYNFKCEAAVPVAGENFVALDNSEVGIEIFYILPEGGKRLLFVGVETLVNLFNAPPSEGGDVWSFWKSNPVSEYQFRLLHPGSLPVGAEDKNKTPEQKTEKPKAVVSLDLSALMEGPPSQTCVSPELIGGGVNTTLFSSHRAVWYDPELGSEKFRPDHVANFLELNLGSLRFPETDQPDDRDNVYFIRARIAGMCVNSPALHRSKKAWSQVLDQHLIDPHLIRYEGQRLLLPLPPGCWGPDSAHLRKVEIQVIKRASRGFKALSYEEFLSRQPGAQGQEGMKETEVYKGAIVFDKRMLVDWQKSVSAFLTKSDQKDAKILEVDVYAGGLSVPTAADPKEAEKLRLDAERRLAQQQAELGVLNMEFCLRDRDHARASQGQSGQKSALCVGDKAMLIVEEPFLYPKNPGDFRKQFCVGEFDPNLGRRAEEYSGSGLPLREPCLSSEYGESGLGELVPKQPFKQSFIPTFCDDIIPHKFVLPLSEKEFLERHKPGYWGRVMDDLAKNARSQGSRLPYISGPNRPVVEHLSHNNRHVPVTILATYAADNTCDIEVSEIFMSKWKSQAYRKFAIPGIRMSAPAAAKDKPPRAVLRQVPMALLSAVHYSGINIYDAEFKTIDDVLKAPAPVNDFDPRSAEASKPNASKDHLQYSMPAGPLPPDATTSACQYEFSIRVRFPNDFEMYQFVAMLRRCVRLDHYQQAQKMLQYQKQQQQAAAAPLQPHKHGYQSGGQLDVVLVAARRLKPMQSALNTIIQSDPISLYEQWTKGTKEADPALSNQMLDAKYLPQLAGTTGGESVKGTPEGSMISTFVNFRMKHDKEVVAYRGQKVQVSPVIDGTDSPSWAHKEELAAAGGWTFRTGNIDPEKYPKLLIEFEVMQAAIPTATRIGIIQLPVTEEQFLTRPNKLFMNLWLPLVSIKDGEMPTPNVTGEIHIMTRWLPAEMKQVLADGQEKLQVSVRSMFMKEIWSKVCQPRIREPIYGIEAQYSWATYDPNTVKPKTKDERRRAPEALKDNVRRHVEELYNTVPYLECLERRQNNAWKNFKDDLTAKNLGETSLGELRLLWQQKEDEIMLGKLHSLVLRGVPSERRHQVWAEVTLASRVAQQDGAGGGHREYADATDRLRAAEQEYQTLLQRGLPQHSDAMIQLQEDAALIAGWESTVPPLPEAVDLHYKRIRKAKNVVTALLACQDSGITYCESILVLAFFMLLPQGYKDANAVSGVNTDVSLTNPNESDVFWLLYTLLCTRTNGIYREYYAVSAAAANQTEHLNLVSGSGAMQDVHLLECCLAYHEKDLYLRMQGMGFQLSTIFYGAFMRWYATYMPTASVFRFWDALLLQSTNPKVQPHGRVYLINLAFGAIRAKRTELMLCESAFEMRSIILGFFGSLYDTSTVIDLVTAADTFLWGGGGYSSGKVANIWVQRDELFKGINHVTKSQNEILKQLCHVMPLKIDSPGTGIKTSELVREVIPVLQVNVDAAQRRGKARYWAMHRPQPMATRVITDTPLDKAWSFFSTQVLAPPKLPLIPFMVGPANAETGPGMEPLDIIASDLVQVIERDIAGWGQQATALWNVFSNRPRNFIGNVGVANQSFLNPSFGNDPYTNYGSGGVIASDEGQGYQQMSVDGKRIDPFQQPRQSALQKWVGDVFGVKPPPSDDNVPQQKNEETGEFVERISLNELYAALICASRGTLSEKANALFNIYAYADPRGKDLNHISPINSVARATAEHAVETAAEVSRVLAPPEPESNEAKQNALRFTVMTNYPHKNTSLGDVFISSLAPYISHASASNFKKFNIWGKLPEGSARFGNQFSQQQQPDRLVCIGELTMSIHWIPKQIQQANLGQLTIHVRTIKFHDFYISDFFSINPWIRVKMCVVEGTQAGSMRKWVEIPRWDPRGSPFTSKGDKVGLTSQGAYGGIIDFESPLRQRTLGGQTNFGQWFRHAENQGFNQETSCWEWNPTWGKQSSKEIQVMAEFVQLSGRRNVMDMTGVRLLVTNILQRCMLNMTNRQCLLVADTIFNRAGVVPGISQAIIAPGRETDPNRPLRQVIEAFDKDKKPYKDVTTEMILEHERQIAHNGGIMNLFAASYMSTPLNLQTMNIPDPYRSQEKTLYVRYVRAGDGERCTQAIAVEKDGSVPVSPESEIFLDGHGQDMWPLNKVTKEEFIACITNSPLLGESIRRLGHMDHIPHGIQPIPLEVRMMDPHQEDAFQDLEEAINIQQSLLLEVWDADFLGMDFLGEAWLPPLSEFGPRAKDIVLPLQSADFRNEAENGASRPDDKKNIKNPENDPNKKITGQVHLSVTWVYPCLEGRGLDIDVDTWLRDLEQKNKLPSNRLLQYRDSIAEQFGTVKQIAQKKVDKNGKLADDFFTVLNISDKRQQDILKKWFQDHTPSAQKDQLKARAIEQENKHTGMLSITIQRAERLRKADAKKQRNCDPKALLWVRNDVRGAWRKKPLMQTARISDNRDPEWNHMETKPLFSGAFEAKRKQPPEGWGAEAGRILSTGRSARHRSEDRDLASVRRFGANGLKIKFKNAQEQQQLASSSSASAAAPQLAEGENHAISVLLTDSIRDFKEKLAAALASEAKYWKETKGPDSEEYLKYEGVEIGNRHVVVAYVPSDKVAKMSQAGLTNTDEYKRQSKIAAEDPSNWQPLDPERSFAQYVNMFGFGKQQQVLRVVETTEKYKAINLRYKQWLEHRHAKGLKDTNDDHHCFGWAKYVHKGDSFGSMSSVEWRPALIGPSENKPPPGEAAAQQALPGFKVKWVHEPPKQDRDEPDLELDRDKVLLAPRVPLFDDNTHPFHKDVLPQARLLRMSGKSDWEIEAQLNKFLDTKWEEAKKGKMEGTDSAPPPRITVDQIRGYLKRQEEQQTGKLFK